MMKLYPRECCLNEVTEVHTNYEEIMEHICIFHLALLKYALCLESRSISISTRLPII